METPVHATIRQSCQKEARKEHKAQGQLQYNEYTDDQNKRICHVQRNCSLLHVNMFSWVLSEKLRQIAPPVMSHEWMRVLSGINRAERATADVRGANEP
jgi:hypothetical protein